MTPGTVRLRVPPESEGARLDRFLAERVEGQTRSALRRLIQDGRVRVDGEPAPKPGFALQPGMRIEVEIPEPPSEQPLPESIPIEVAHEDDHLLVVNKPAGLVVHPGHGNREGTLVNALLGLGVPLARTGSPDRPGIVHRLDKDTSGLLIVAKSREAHRGLTAAFAKREIKKRYQAIVWGHPSPPAGTIERGIGRSRSDRTRMSVRVPSGRSAVTRYRTVESLRGFAVLDLDLETGRTHQIRVHMQSIHHPLVGDARYGGRLWKGIQHPVRRKALREFRRLALHASDLRFRHPVGGRVLEIHSELPAEFQDLLALLRSTS
jgi:23S rRNA pseudouridine1911/1915/1917 synthase